MKAYPVNGNVRFLSIIMQQITPKNKLAINRAAGIWGAINGLSGIDP